MPTVVIASVVMFAVLVAVSGVVASSRVSLDTQYYEGLATDAAESGGEVADNCLKANGYVSTWGSNSLKPNTNCSGAVVAGQSNTVVQSSTFNTTYTVSPVTASGTGTQTIQVTGTVNLTRSSNGAVWKTYTKTLMLRTGGAIATSRVVFGYSNGAFFGTIGGNGNLYATGYNGFGQLGNGSYSSTLTPKKFLAPTASPIVAGYASFLSAGMAMFARDNTGKVFAAGYNNGGMLGISSASTYSPTPQQVVLPAGKTVRSVTPGGASTFFVTDDNNVYAAGACLHGLLGTGYTIAGCSDQNTPVRVALPTPNPADPNTIPTDNIVTDWYSVYIRMAGGRVYGWGTNDVGQLGNVNFVDTATPTKLGTFGDTGSPRAMKVMTDGVTLNVLGSDGKVYSLGENDFGQMGTGMMSFRIYTTGMCMDNAGANGVTIQVYTCNESPAQKFEIRSDGTVYNANKNVCLQTPDGSTLNLAACDGTAKQKFSWQPSTTYGNAHLVNTSVNKCVDNTSYGVSGTSFALNACNGYANQIFYGLNATFTKFNYTGISGATVDFATDQWSLSILTSNGEVWSGGVNTSGQFGGGSVGSFQPFPIKFNMPVPATYIYETNVGATDMYGSQNLLAVGSNGRVYGAGSNQYGQLGNGTVSDHVATPVVMSVIDGTNIVASQVQIGKATAVIFTTNGNVYTVGYNNYGQLGDGTTNNSSIPIRAKYVNDLKTIAY